MTHSQKLDAVFNVTHSDFKGSFGEERYILVCRDGGTQPVCLRNLTDAEVAVRLPKRVA